MIEFGEYGLGSDSSNWIIYVRRVSPKTQEVRWDARYFYFHLHDALAGLWNDHLKQQDHNNVKSLMDAVMACTARVEAAGKASLRPGRRAA
jgi:hypothetical protein